MGFQATLTGVLTRTRTCKDRDKQGECHVIAKAEERCSHKPGNTGNCQQPPEARKRQGRIPLQFQRGMALQAPWLWTPSLDAEIIHVCCL